MESRKDENLAKLKEEKAKLQAAAKDAQAKSDELRQKEALTNDTKSTMGKVSRISPRRACFGMMFRCRVKVHAGIARCTHNLWSRPTTRQLAWVVTSSSHPWFVVAADPGAGGGQEGRAGAQEGRVRAGPEGPGAAQGVLSYTICRAAFRPCIRASTWRIFGQGLSPAT